MSDNHSVFNTVYVALAERSGLQLVTGDSTLAGFDWVVAPEQAMGAARLPDRRPSMTPQGRRR